LRNAIFRAVAKTAAIAMNQHEQGHATASAGSLFFASLLGCLTVLSACPPEKVQDDGEMKPDWPHDRNAPTLKSSRFLPACEALVRLLENYCSDWLPNAIFRRIKPVQSRYGSDDPALN
jgi:hypothetical protein